MAHAYEDIRSDYAAARASRYRRRRTGLNPMGSGADSHYRNESDYLKLLENARDMDRNDVIVGQMVDRVVDNTVQDGFRLDVHTGDESIDTDLEARWKEWAEDPDECDVAGEQTFCEMERLALRHMLVDGDVLALPLKEGQLQMIEGHRLRTPSNTKQNVVLGVLLNEQRKRQEYWIAKEDVDPNKALKLVSEVERIDARDAAGYRQVFHLLNPKRVSQTRGVTAFAPIFDCLGMLEDIQFARLVQQQVVSCFAILRQRDLQFNSNGTPPQTGAQTTDTLADGSSRVIQGIAPGMDLASAPGETISGFSPNVPNPEYFDHVRLILQMIGINLGLPLVLLLLDASETNFSGFRGAVDQARLGFKRNQAAMIRKFHCPAYLWKVRQWIAEDVGLRKVQDEKKFNLFGHTWHSPKWPYIEPLKDAQAAILRLKNLLTSPRREHATDGQDFYEIVDEAIEDNGYAIEQAKAKAAAINKRFPDDPNQVHWREIISIPMPEGIQIALGGNEPQPMNEPARKKKEPANG